MNKSFNKVELRSIICCNIKVLIFNFLKFYMKIFNYYNYNIYSLLFTEIKKILIK